MTVNIAFFGDSQTENVDIPAQYSYTEPLDFLLNINRVAVDSVVPGLPGQTTGFQVLNFGRRGYGPARSYLRWLQLPERGKLAHVFYMVCKNDLADLEKALRSNLVLRGASGEMLTGIPLTPPPWKRVLAHLHITYLAVDAWQRVRSDGAPGEGQLSHDDLILMFHDVVRRWKSEVEAHGAAFHVVLLPNPIEGFGGAMRNEWLRTLRSDAAFATEIGFFDLAQCFQTEIPGFHYRDWRFDKNPHWNSAANMVAATCLYRYLADALSLPDRTDDDLANARYAYYRAFLDSPAWEGQRYMPDEAWARPSNTREASRGEAIVARYLALELRPQMEGQWLGAVRAAREAGPSATSVWDIYANARERLLVYVKSPCAANWRARGHAVRFFLHGVPFTAEKLPGHHVGASFANLDHSPLAYIRRQADECVFVAELPDYPLTRVRTGQFTRGDDGAIHDLWRVEFPMPLARSVWDVYASSQGRGLEYVKKSCGPNDTQARFFVHVYPLRSADLPAYASHYQNLDFSYGDRPNAGNRLARQAEREHPHGTCRAYVALPDFPIAFVRTGQFRTAFGASKRLWSERIDFAELERVPSGK